MDRSQVRIDIPGAETAQPGLHLRLHLQQGLDTPDVEPHRRGEPVPPAGRDRAQLLPRDPPGGRVRAQGLLPVPLHPRNLSLQCALQAVPPQAHRMLRRLSRPQAQETRCLLVGLGGAVAGGCREGFQAVCPGCLLVLAASLGSLNIK